MGIVILKDGANPVTFTGLTLGINNLNIVLQRQPVHIQ